MQVFLFDVDGTLIHTCGAGGAALRHALCDEFQIAEAGDVAFSGRTDRAIVRSFFQLHGIEESDANWQRLRDGYLRRLPDYLPQRQGYVLPGVAELLGALAPNEKTAVGLLTGNVREGARIKLGFFGLFDQFAFGGFGDDHHDRDYVARDALTAARDHINGQSASLDVWVIGDTPMDISCGRAIQARVLAVATGLHPREELASLRPDIVMDDLRDTQQLLDRLSA